MNTRAFEKRHGVTQQNIIDSCTSQSTMVKAAESLKIPYKSFLRITKKLGCYIPNQGGKGLIGKSPSSKIPLSEILQGLHPYYHTHKLRLRLIKEGLKEHKCEICNLTEWNSMKIPLTLDHIDGNNSNHLYENIRLLCPNCHAQTPTFSCKRR
jgi:hypothetical protein